MSFLTGTHRFLDPKCNEVLDQFYECIQKKSRAIGACEHLLIKLYRCKKEDVSEADRERTKRMRCVLFLSVGNSSRNE